MATTNASCKLHHRSNACDEPMISGSKRKRRNDTTGPSTNYMINDRSNRQAREPMQQGHRRHKHSNEHCNNIDISSSKRQRRRRRYKEELAYKAATIQQALNDDTEGRRIGL